MAELGKSLVLFHLVLFSWLIAQVASVLVAPIAKPGCDSRCGNVSIPYPFGTGDGCFVDDWFEIICDNSTTIPKPFMNSTKLEVMEISVEGTLRVRNPITFFNCSDKETGRQSANLERSPFFFSQNNRFAAVGCGSIALMNSGSASIGGCSSICSATSNNSCNGINCCQTTIPSDLKAFNTSFLSIDAENENQCKFAFMVDQHWFSSSSTNISAIPHMVDVPLELKWELYHSTSDVFGVFVATNETSNSADPRCYWNSTISEYECYRNSSCDTYTVTSFQSRIECSCGGGFEGNPYVLDGCVDINECMEGFCEGEGLVCRNSAGGYICYPRESEKSRVKEALIGVSSGILGLMFLLTCAWSLHKFLIKRRKEKFFKLNGGLLLQQQLSSGEANIEKTKLFKSNELQKATDQFSANRVLGQGGQGTVYKGMLADGKIVAVKKSTRVDQGKVSEFINEVVILSQINHRNVVKLLGCCLETQVPLLVYEFIPNGTLYQYIHDKKQDFPLTLETRLRIATEIAAAISYLHSAASFPIYHRDIKSSNILLDEKYRAKIADFGTSRSIAIEQTHLTTLVYGTFGYLDPEYFQSSQFTDKSDVYSFGVVLVELLTGQKPISKARAEEGKSLATYFIASMEDNRLFDIVDVRVMMDGNKEAIMEIANLAKRCLNLSGKKRPSMKQVAMELERIQKSAKPSNHAQQNFEESEYDQNEVSFISGWSHSYTGSASPSDVQPLVSFSH
ncbi:hypothetical protein FNV43_RR13837 [Rhamnella rubrinervis]|uniref:Protein kinase domain-containing protein n=1 Tax=Rhamnella rubrinervis TaxID=2594499 RepID=A0A8K0H1V8_9ROSA|nr:hypothetical protein FNV43_RR13837 [Rhamnella rubrinervis]